MTCANSCLKYSVQEPRLVGQDRQRGVGAHRADGLLPIGGHRRDQPPQVFLGVAERLLALEHRLVLRLLHRPCRQVVDAHEVLVEPRPVGTLLGQLTLDLFVVDDAPLGRVDEKDLAGMETLLDQDVLRRDVQHADLRRHDHEVVLGDVIA